MERKKLNLLLTLSLTHSLTHALIHALTASSIMITTISVPNSQTCFAGVDKGSPVYRCDDINCSLDIARANLVCVECHDHAINPSRVHLKVRMGCKSGKCQRDLAKTNM